MTEDELGRGPLAADPLATSVLFDVYAVGQAVGRLLSTAMADGPLSPTEYALYSGIFELEAVTPTDLADRLGMPLTTLMDRLRDLERDGRTRRIANPRDGRSYLVTLTADGLAAHRAANRRFELAYRAFIDGLPGGEQPAKAALAAIRAAAEAVIARSERPGAEVSLARRGDRAG